MEHNALAPAIILVRPQLGDNIGASLRAMRNGGLRDLRLVLTPDQWLKLSDRAAVTAAGARRFLDDVQIFPTVTKAIADVQCLYAATARRRDLNKDIITPRHCGQRMRRDWHDEVKSAVLFGPEASGLDNDDLSRADVIITAPMDFTSLNLAQAVLLVAYEWHLADNHQTMTRNIRKGARLASHGDIELLFEHLEHALSEVGFFESPEQQPVMMYNIRAMFLRASLLDREVRALRGIVESLRQQPAVKKHQDQVKKGAATRF